MDGKKGLRVKFKNLNFNNLLVFTAVFRSNSMTLAAKELGMTQPGVTQHIKNLENLLNVEFFHRVGKKLIPTKEAEILFEGLGQPLETIDLALYKITQKDRLFAGSVKIGVPIEFGNTMVLPKLAKIRSRFQDVQFYITYGLPHELNTLLVEGKLDFAFIDQYQVNPALTTEIVFRENLILCCSREYYGLAGQYKKERKFFEALNYVAYQPGEPIVRNWLDRAFGFKKMNLKVAAYSFDVQGVAALVTSSMGVGVLPEHVFLKLKSEGHELYQFRPKVGPVSNPISLAYLEQRYQVPLNQYVVTVLKEMLMGK
ncbi:MAG TPA: LysR family transcriptional regulator [Bacteriovoracaceae bacterium]|nr:LysR family transcriptional regulator [Bacteriovoracaceae bacterium]